MNERGPSVENLINSSCGKVIDVLNVTCLHCFVLVHVRCVKRPEKRSSEFQEINEIRSLVLFAIPTI